MSSGSSIAPTSLALRKKRYTTLSTSILHTQPPGVKQPRRRSTEVTRPQHTQNTQFRDAGLCQTIVSVGQACHHYSYGSYNRGDRSWLPAKTLTRPRCCLEPRLITEDKAGGPHQGVAKGEHIHGANHNRLDSRAIPPQHHTPSKHR